MITNHHPNPAETDVNVINLSNHLVPEQAFRAIKAELQVENIRVWQCQARFDFNQDLWKQVEEIMEELGERDKEGYGTPFTAEGKTVLLLPAAKEAAVLIATYIGAVRGIAPFIGLVGKDESYLPVLKQLLNLEAFYQKARNSHRKKQLSLV